MENIQLPDLTLQNQVSNFLDQGGNNDYNANNNN